MPALPPEALGRNEQLQLKTPLVIITARPAAGLAPSSAPVSPPPALPQIDIQLD